jgi:hypothetical protein
MTSGHAGAVHRHYGQSTDTKHGRRHAPVDPGIFNGLHCSQIDQASFSHFFVIPRRLACSGR